ncbi:MAG: hypothetical protein KDH93_18570 [Rhodoferax sp.]|nr:hypothetical protein [Rhodoferax sp.]MCP5260269.1 hypothetical protein [Rhodoferax sp.]
MHLSPFFHQLRSAYVAEIEDLSQDSEGGFVLQQRLAQRRGELEFLVHMLELSPEMVAVVFHKAFAFGQPLVIEQMLGCESEELPDWDDIAGTITIAPWAQPMVRTIRAQPAGDWFMTVAAGAEYMLGMSGRSLSQQHADDDAHDADGVEPADHDDEQHYLSADDDVGTDAQAREEASADWMVEQGFDRKD